MTSITSHTSKPTTLTHRLLFPYLPYSDPIPPLLLSTSAVDGELYDFIALALRAFVNPWWTKITAKDKQFLVEITRIITAFSRALEHRLLATDLPSLVFRDIPTVITQHYVDYRNAAAKLNTSYSAGNDLPHMFHHLQPHIAVSPEGDIDQTYLRQVIEHVMKACLPPEDWHPDTERTIVREIVVKILVGISTQLTQPWFIQKVLLDILGPPKGVNPPLPPPRTKPPFSLQSAIVLILSSIQFISGLCLTFISFFQSSLHVIATVNSRPPSAKPFPSNTTRPSIDMIAEILTMRSRAAPSAILSLIELLVGFFSPFLDRLLPYLLQTQIFPVSVLNKIVVQSKKALFPNGYPSPPPPDPTAEEQIIIREQLEMTMAGLLPPTLAPLLLGPSLSTTISAAIEPLTSQPCNAHLIIVLLDLILATVFPELGVGGTNVDVDFPDELIPPSDELDDLHNA